MSTSGKEANPSSPKHIDPSKLNLAGPRQSSSNPSEGTRPPPSVGNVIEQYFHEDSVLYNEYLKVKNNNEINQAALQNNLQGLEEKKRELEQDLEYIDEKEDPKTFAGLQKQIGGFVDQINKIKSKIQIISNDPTLNSLAATVREKILTHLPEILTSSCSSKITVFYNFAMKNFMITEIDVANQEKKEEQEKKAEREATELVEVDEQVPYKEVLRASYAIDERGRKHHLNGEPVYIVRVRRERADPVGTEIHCSKGGKGGGNDWSKNGHRGSRDDFGSSAGKGETRGQPILGRGDFGLGLGPKESSRPLVDRETFGSTLLTSSIEPTSKAQAQETAPPLPDQQPNKRVRRDEKVIKKAPVKSTIEKSKNIFEALRK